MNDVLKQRLVGALILLALGVVFWPIIFVQPGDRPAAEQASIPPRPEVNTVPIEPPDQVGLRPPVDVEARSVSGIQAARPEQPPATTESTISEEAEEPEPAAAATPVPLPTPEPTPTPAPRTREAPPEKLVMDSQGVPVAWILQVASVSSAEKAEQLRQQLLDKDQKAYTRKIKRDGRELYRVYIGPKFERERLESLQSEVDREFGVKSLIVRYVP